MKKWWLDTNARKRAGLALLLEGAAHISRYVYASEMTVSLCPVIKSLAPNAYREYFLGLWGMPNFGIDALAAHMANLLKNQGTVDYIHVTLYERESVQNGDSTMYDIYHRIATPLGYYVAYDSAFFAPKNRPGPGSLPTLYATGETIGVSSFAALGMLEIVSDTYGAPIYVTTLPYPVAEVWQTHFRTTVDSARAKREDALRS